MITSRRLSKTVVGGIGILLAGVFALLLAIVVAAQSQLAGVPITSDPANDLRPAWSPDGQQIAFFSARTGNYDIWVMNADGSDLRQLTSDPGDDRRPFWSPDGAHIVFDSDRSGSRDIWIMDVDGQNQRQFTRGAGLHTFPAWSPDGSQIAFYSYENGIMDIWVAEVDSFLTSNEPGQTRQLTSGLSDETQNGCTFGCHVPAWSPDSAHIAYLGGGDQRGVWVMSADGSDPYQVSAGGELEHFPSWTPDGHLLFMSEHANDQGELINDVWKIDSDGANPSLVLAGIPHGGPLYWNPADPQIIAFHSPRGGNFDIYTILLDESAILAEAAQITRAPYDEEAAAGIGRTQAEADATATAEATVVAPTAEPAPPPAQAERGSNALLIAGAAALLLAGLALVFYVVRRTQ